MEYGGKIGRKGMHFNPEDMVKPKVTKEMLIRIGRYFIPYWKQLIFILVAISVSSVLGLVPTMLTKNIVDKALPHKDLGLLIRLIIASFGATILLSLIGVGQNYLNTWVSRHIIFDIKNQMYRHLQYMSLSFFSSTKPGEIITRMTSDINGIQEVFNGTLIQLLRSLLVIIATAAAMFTMNIKLAVVGIFILPLFIGPTRKVGKVRWKIASQTQEKVSDLNHHIQESLGISGAILMKIFTKESDEYNKFKKVNEEVVKLQIKESLAGRWFSMTMNVFSTIGPMLIYLYGGYLYINDEISVGSIIAFVALLHRLYGPVTQLSNMYIDVTRSLALFERIFDYFDKQQDITDKTDAIKVSKIRGMVEFKNVGFSYNNQQDTLNNINFMVYPGEMFALVGPSGAGKTTITNLISRLYDVSSGSVRIDQIDVRNMTQESLRAQIGIVMQEPYLFNGTIRENLLYGKKDATEEEIINACKSAYIHDFIMTLPEGYDTIVGNRGMKLSGGEKQRVSIARVILKDPRILILDEATSSLDSVSEALIQKALGILLKGRTSFVIAHRLSTIITADEILVLKDGNIVEQGKHEVLLNQDGLYKELFDRQFKARA